MYGNYLGKAQPRFDIAVSPASKLVKSSCKECKERYVGCHGTCQKYLDYKKALNRANVNYYKSKQLDCIYESYEIESTQKRRSKGTKKFNKNVSY